MTLEKFSYKYLESMQLPWIICKPWKWVVTRLFKGIDILNLLYKNPHYKQLAELKGKPTLNTLKNKYIKELKFLKNGLYNYKYENNIDDVGDQGLHNGIYAAYRLNIFNDNKFFLNYIKQILIRNDDGDLVLLRGINIPKNKNIDDYEFGNLLRDDCSGDQLGGFVLACSEYRKQNGKLPDIVHEFFNQFFKEIECKFLNIPFIKFKSLNCKLYQLDGTVSKHGNLNPNIFMSAFPIGIVLAAAVVSGNWKAFNYLYYKCGYKYMLPHLNLYVLGGEIDTIKPVVFGKKITGQRSWFNYNLAAVGLSILNTWDKHSKRKFLYQLALDKLLVDTS